MGIICDKIGGRYSILTSVSGCAISNIALGIYITSHPNSPSFNIVTLLYSINVCFQGLGTSSIIAINSHWYRSEEIGLFSGIFNIITNAGYYLAMGVCPSFIQSYGFDSYFYLTGFLLLVMTLILAIFLKNAPEVSNDDVEASITIFNSSKDIELSKLDSPPKEKVQSKVSEEEKLAQIKLKKKEVALDRKALLTPTFLSYLGAIVCCCWMKDGLLSWTLLFLETVSETGDGLSENTTALIGFALTLGGIGGGVIINYTVDRFFSGQRALALISFSFLQLISLILFWFTAVKNFHILIIAILFFFTCLFMLGIYSVLCFLTPADLPQ